MGAPRFVLDRFWPSNLFLGGIPGAWYDPTDLSTMFQDSAGTTPVTAVEQPVGLILDKSQGLALGADVVTNGGFSSGASWTLGAGGGSATIAAGLLTLSGGAAAFPNATQSGILTAGRWYRVTVVLTTPIALNSLSFRMGGGTTTYSGFTAAGTYTLTLLADATNLVFLRNSGFTDTVNVDSVSVIPLAGNHASQSTAASRPTYRARYNALTQSEDFSQAVWIKTGTGTGSAPAVTTDAATAPDGTLTADSIVFNRGAGNTVGDQSSIAQAPTVLNATYTQTVWLKAATPADVGKQLGLRNVAASSFVTVTLTADWVRYTRTETGAIANWEITNRGTITTSNTVTALVWGAQLLTAADVTATGNAYQRIAAATVYDTAAVFRPYLAFDGVDDSLSTSAINFTSTDKMTAFAGLSKLSDATAAIFTELSATTSSNAGSFYIAAPEATGASGNFTYKSRGSLDITPTSPGAYLSPTTRVLSCIGEIASDTATLRINGAQAVNSTGDQGTGAYGNYPLYIGRRGGTTLPFNGRLYSLIVRGAASSVTEIADTELWVNARTGAY